MSETFGIHLLREYDIVPDPHPTRMDWPHVRLGDPFKWYMDQNIVKLPDIPQPWQVMFRNRDRAESGDL